MRRWMQNWNETFSLSCHPLICIHLPRSKRFDRSFSFPWKIGLTSIQDSDESQWKPIVAQEDNNHTQVTLVVSIIVSCGVDDEVNRKLLENEALCAQRESCRQFGAVKVSNWVVNSFDWQPVIAFKQAVKDEVRDPTPASFSENYSFVGKFDLLTLYPQDCIMLLRSVTLNFPCFITSWETS